MMTKLDGVLKMRFTWCLKCSKFRNTVKGHCVVCKSWCRPSTGVLKQAGVL